MYEARQNKEKVSRTIDGDLAKQRRKVEDAGSKIKVLGHKGNITQFVFPPILGRNNPDYQANTNLHFCECWVVKPLTEGNNATGKLPAGCENMDRGHLIPKRFGGIGNNKNWLPICHQTNNGPMKKNENAVFKALEEGTFVHYTVQGVFKPGNNYPTFIFTTAVNFMNNSPIPGVKNLILNGEQ